MNALYHGDSVEVLRDQVPGASVDPIYLEPQLVVQLILVESCLCRLQIRTLAELLSAKGFEHPQSNATLMRAEREEGTGECTGGVVVEGRSCALRTPEPYRGRCYRTRAGRASEGG